MFLSEKLWSVMYLRRLLLNGALEIRGQSRQRSTSSSPPPVMFSLSHFFLLSLLSAFFFGGVGGCALHAVNWLGFSAEVALEQDPPRPALPPQGPEGHRGALSVTEQVSYLTHTDTRIYLALPPLSV